MIKVITRSFESDWKISRCNFANKREYIIQLGRIILVVRTSF